MTLEKDFSPDIIETDDFTSDSDSKLFSLCGDSEIFMVSQDSDVLFYTKDLEQARKNMWDLTLKYQTHFSDIYNTHIIVLNEDQIQIIGSYKWFILQYENVLFTFSVKKCLQLEEIKMSEASEMEVEDKKDIVRVNIPLVRRLGFRTT